MKKLLILLIIPFLSFGQSVMFVPSEYTTIQNAINEAVDGDTILISPGIYYENIDYLGKNLIIGSLYLSTGDKENIVSTIIDGNQAGSVVTFNSSENNSSKLIGLTIRNGYSEKGGGIYCGNSCSPYLENLHIINNEAIDFGGGIYLDLAANATIKRCLISNNSASGANGNGGGIGGFGWLLYPLIENCTITSNTAWESGSGIYINPGSNTDFCNIEIINTILWNEALLCPYCSSGNSYEEISTQQDGSTEQDAEQFTISYSLVRGGWIGTEILDSDPLFFDPINQNYNLTETSPCINTGNPNIIYNDPDGSICDIGAFPLPIYGCLNPGACNYNPDANNNDGSCDYSCYCDTIYIDNFITDTLYLDNFITDTLYIDNFITDTIIEIVYENYYIYDTIVETEYVDVIITEYVDCETFLPCESGIEEVIEKSKTDGQLYNLLGQEINRREGIYIEGGEVKYRF